jgi:uncharacterized sodium:solute symporter family permease YidK
MRSYLLVLYISVVYVVKIEVMFLDVLGAVYFLSGN